MRFYIITIFISSLLVIIIKSDAIDDRGKIEDRVFWPSGTYGLPKPKGECPLSDGQRWKSGWRKHDAEDTTDGRYTEISPNFRMDAQILGGRNDLNRSFCVKTVSGTSKRYWPKGSYCIYKKGDCPNNMMKGWVRWDDEDYNNGNLEKPVLPDGRYDENTIIYYCCQAQGFWWYNIELPIDTSFYLMPRNTKSLQCQVVKWTLAFLEYIVFDTNDQDNRDDKSGSHAFLYDNDSKLKVFYCFYQACRYEIKETTSGPLSAPARHSDERYPQYQHCAWLITVDPADIVQLTFNLFDNFDCSKSFVHIYDGSDEYAPLLATICQQEIARTMRLFSTNSSIFVVIDAGTYPRSLNPQYELQYQSVAKIENNFTLQSNDSYLEWISPNGPLIGYPSRFFWSIILEEFSIVLLNFTNLIFPSCHSSSLRIYDGASSVYFTTLCGANATAGQEVLCYSNHVVLEVDAGQYLEMPYSILKMVVKYTIEDLEPNNHFAADNGSFFWQSPSTIVHGYPNAFAWLLTVNEKSTLILNISAQLLAASCKEISVTFYDGKDETSAILTVLCGSNATSHTTIPRSSTNNVYVILKTSKYFPHSSLSVTYVNVPREEPTQSTVVASDSPVTVIVIAVVLSVFAIVLAILVVVIIRKRRQKRLKDEASSLRCANRSYESRISADANQTASNNLYEIPAPQEKLCVVGSVVCKESENPIYDPATTNTAENDTYLSTDNITYEPAITLVTPNTSADYAIPTSAVYAVPENATPAAYTIASISRLHRQHKH